MSLDLSTDYVVFDEDDLKSLSNSTVVHVSRLWNDSTNTYTDTTTSCPNTLRLNSIVQEKEKSTGAYIEREARFYLATQAFDSLFISKPKVGDLIVQNDVLQTDEIGRTWTILKVRKPVFNDCWTCDCIILDIQAALDTVIDIYTTSESTNSDGDRILNPVIHQPGLSARIQPDVQQVIDNLGKRILLSKYVVYVKGLSNYNFTFGDFVLHNNVKYKIVGVSNDRSLTDLITLNVERIF